MTIFSHCAESSGWLFETLRRESALVAQTRPCHTPFGPRRQNCSRTMEDNRLPAEVPGDAAEHLPHAERPGLQHASGRTLQSQSVRVDSSVHHNPAALPDRGQWTECRFRNRSERPVPRSAIHNATYGSNAHHGPRLQFRVDARPSKVIGALSVHVDCGVSRWQLIKRSDHVLQTRVDLLSSRNDGFVPNNHIPGTVIRVTRLPSVNWAQ